METRTIAATTHGRYLVDGPRQAPMLVGFHGYGENASTQLEILKRIASGNNWLLVSVQGLHRFYNRTQNYVVAGWMTSEDRDLAIADNLAYVKSVVEEARADFDAQAPTVFVGFSQGVAMAYRAAAFVAPCDGLIALAGDVPPDVALVAKSLPKILLGRGKKDDWYNEEKASKDVETLKSAGVAFEHHVFDGGHEWSDAFIAKARQFIEPLNP